MFHMQEITLTFFVIKKKKKKKNEKKKPSIMPLGIFVVRPINKKHTFLPKKKKKEKAGYLRETMCQLN